MARRKSGFDAEAAQRMSTREIAAFLDERERRFADEYGRDLNGTAAAIRAGYKAGKDGASAAVQASRLLRDPRVRAYRAAKYREETAAEIVTQEHMALELLKIYRRCMQVEPVLEWDSAAKEWVPSGEYRFDARGAIKALEQLSRLLGVDAPKKVDLSGTLTTVSASMEEKMRMLKEMVRELAEDPDG